MGYVFKSFFLFAKIEEDNILSNCSTEKVNEKKKKEPRCSNSRCIRNNLGNLDQITYSISYEFC